MIRGLFGIVLILVTGWNSCWGADLPRSTPEAQGVSSAAVLDFLEAADKQCNSLHSVMLVRHGQVVTEGWWAPYRPQSPHQLYSLSKSFTSTGVGIAIAEGKLRLDDHVLKFFPEDAPEKPSDNLKAMRVSDLLRMNTGHQNEPPRPLNQSWRKAFLAHPVPFKPGTHFLYNTSATYMLSAIVQKATGQNLLDYLTPRLFEPLGIEKPTWEMSPDGEAVGGYGLNVRTEDIAKFGQLYLQRGTWNGKQLVPADWIDEATARQTSNGSNPQSDWDQGYGYQFWRCRNRAYRGDGAFGQYCIVLPEYDAVIAITSGLRDMQLVLNLVWDKLLPGLEAKALPANDAVRQKLEARLKGLSIPVTAENGRPSLALGKTYLFESNDRKLESLILKPDAGRSGMLLIATFNGQQHRIPCGAGQWHDAEVGWGSFRAMPGATCGAWIDDQTYAAQICFYETPFIVTIRVKFTGEELECQWESNVAFGPREQPPLKGKLSAQ
jgi:CubicO group peptidase (beta-lactamase class C family)